MSRTPQTSTQSVLQHGLSVWLFVQKILMKDTEGLRLPDWFLDNYDNILRSLHDREIMKAYAIMHDCGKPYCKEIDAEGKQHFPNHAAISEQTYASIKDANPNVARLIGLDMLLHTANADEITALSLSREDAFTLLVTAFAEIHSNAGMFGGIETVSFKSKWKTLDRRGKMLCKRFFNACMV